jgi:hypothetical protein
MKPELFLSARNNYLESAYMHKLIKNVIEMGVCMPAGSLNNENADSLPVSVSLNDDCLHYQLIHNGQLIFAPK